MCSHCGNDPCGLSCTALDALPIAIGRVSRGGVLEYANATYARLHGRARRELVGQPVWRFFASPSDRAGSEERFAELAALRPTPEPVLVEIVTAADEVVPLVVDWQYEVGADGALVGFTCVVRDPHREHDLRAALQQIGMILIENGVCSHVLPLEADDRRVPGLSLLSPRELEVTEMLAKGYRAPAIARKLSISANTVRNHLKKAYQKLGVHSQEQLLDLVTGRSDGA